MGDEPTAVELVFPDVSTVQESLTGVGFVVPIEAIKQYCYASWG